MKAEFVLFHEDCGEFLIDGFCEKCGFGPDMQSLLGTYFCPTCNVELIGVVCPVCSVMYEKP
jgi:hypothetical protein